MTRTVTRSIRINADYDKVADFLAQVETMPRWTVFANRVWKKDGKYFAETGQGEAEVWIDFDRSTGEIVYRWKIDGREDYAPSQLKVVDGQLEYTFTAREPAGAPEGMLEKMAHLVEEELQTLRQIAEEELTRAAAV